MKSSVPLQRVRSGCVTCRIRKVKCDEAKPSCNRCTSTGRKCDGYPGASGSTPRKKALGYAGAPNTHSTENCSQQGLEARRRDGSGESRRDIIPEPQNCIIPLQASPSSHVWTTAGESRAFDLFRSRILGDVTEFFESGLWDQLVPQLCHHEPAIKHALLALSSMYEQFQFTRGPGASSVFALEQYTRALKHSKQLLARRKDEPYRLEKVLIACVLFAIYEIMSRNYDNAAIHFQTGHRVLGDRHELPEPSARSAALQELSNILDRLDLQAMVFKENEAVTPDSYKNAMRSMTLEKNPTIDSLDRARAIIVNILRHAMWVGESLAMLQLGFPRVGGMYSLAPTMLDAYCRQAECIQALQAWWVAFENLSPSLRDSPGGMVVRMHGIVARTLIMCAANPSEMVWDRHMSDFEEIVRIAERLPPSRKTCSGVAAHDNFAGTTVFNPVPDLGPILPLFLTGSRCRDPSVRRRAIDLLLSVNRKEGVWESVGAGMVARFTLEVEEGFVDGPVVRAEHVPQDKRISYVTFEVQEEKRKIDVRAHNFTGSVLQERTIQL